MASLLFAGEEILAGRLSWTGGLALMVDESPGSLLAEESLASSESDALVVGWAESLTSFGSAVLVGGWEKHLCGLWVAPPNPPD